MRIIPVVKHQSSQLQARICHAAIRAKVRNASVYGALRPRTCLTALRLLPPPSTSHRLHSAPSHHAMPGRKSQTERELCDLESPSPSGSEEEQDQVGSLGAGPSVRKKKRKRLSDLSAEERFQNMPLKEKQKLSAQYRALQADADGEEQNGATALGPS